LRATRSLVTTATDGGVGERILIPIDGNRTRLIFRDRDGSTNSGLMVKAYRWLAWDPIHFTMQHRMLLGVKARAEGRLGDPASIHYAARFGWIAAGALLLWIFATERRARFWIALPLLAAMPALLLAHDRNAALAGFLAVGITTAGAVRWGRRWWPSYSLIAAAVLLILLLTADAYVAFGLIFDMMLALVCGLWLVDTGSEAFLEGQEVRA
jgi:hypothetical protein